MAGSVQMLGAVLTGGESRRMGADKANLELDGERLGARAVRILASELEEVVVVSRQAGAHPNLGAREIGDLLPGNGPLGGLQAALAAARRRPVFALACDLPAVGTELVRHLIEVGGARIAAADGARAVVPILNGRSQPLCAVYSPGCRPEIDRRLASGSLRLLDLVEAIATERVELDPGLPFYRPDLLENLNDPKAAKRWGLGALTPERQRL